MNEDSAQPRPANPRHERISARFEQFMPALGHLLFAAAGLEKAMLADLVARRVIGEGPDAVFGNGLIYKLEAKSAGALLTDLRKFGYEADLAGDLADLIGRRNHFVHHLLDDPDLVDSLTSDEAAKQLTDRIEVLAGDILRMVARLEPDVTEHLQSIFGSPSQMLARLKELDPETIDDEELRRQLESFQSTPDDLIGS